MGPKHVHYSEVTPYFNFLQLTTPEHGANPAGRISPGPAPGMLRQVLLGNDPFLEDEEETRVRLSSVSGKPVLQRGMGLVIGAESSSESE